MCAKSKVLENIFYHLSIAEIPGGRRQTWKLLFFFHHIYWKIHNYRNQTGECKYWRNQKQWRPRPSLQRPSTLDVSAATDATSLFVFPSSQQMPWWKQRGHKRPCGSPSFMPSLWFNSRQQIFRSRCWACGWGLRLRPAAGIISQPYPVCCLDDPLWTSPSFVNDRIIDCS